MMQLMSRCFPLMICMICCLQVQAQQGNVWVFGNKAGISFKSGTPVPITTNITTIEGSASVCNAAGDLLFYTEGSTLWDRNGVVTPNGTDITGLALPGFSPTASTTQSSLIVPMPDSAGKYFVFSLTDGTIRGIHNLYYSVVDMRLNGGLGDIVAGRKGILLDSVLSEKLTATVGKCCNIWVVVNKTNGNFHAFEITAAGLNISPVTSPSGINNGFGYNFGEIKFSPDGNKMAAGSQTFFGLKLYDFDGYTGIFSNIQTLRHKDFYGVCFSPDNTKLYAAADSIYQYDVSLSGTALIVGSEQKLARLSSLTNVKSAPDGKLYYAGLSGIDVIDFPNLPAPACQVRSNAVHLLPGTNTVFGGLSNEVAVLVRDTMVFQRTDTVVCFKDSISLQVPVPGCDYIWEDGSIGLLHTVTQSGHYIVRYHTPPCRFHTDTIAVRFASRVPLTGRYNGCGQRRTAYLFVLPGRGDTFPYSYTWRDSAGNTLRQVISSTGDTLFHINPGRYTVAMSGNGCDTLIRLTLLPPDRAVASFSTDTVICLGDTSTFTNTSLGFTSFVWFFGDGDTSTLVSPRHYYAAPGTYRVLLISYPCIDTVASTVVVDSASYLSFTTDKDHYCLGEGTIFRPHYPPGARSLVWDYGDGTTGQSFSPQHAFDPDGRYIVKVAAQFRACRDTSFTDTVTVYPYPRVNLGADTFMCKDGNPIILYNHFSQAGVYESLWSTGSTAPTILAAGPATYFLTVRNEHQCTATDSIEVRKSCYIDIPNAFTPNDDGLNDYFFPRDLLSHALSSFRMQIFNRWGAIVFETNSPTGRGWDGRFNNLPQSQGVYIYLIEARFENGVAEKYQGNLTLMR